MTKKIIPGNYKREEGNLSYIAKSESGFIMHGELAMFLLQAKLQK
jgi:hypothetical protein